jgi:hypothetical protein
VAHVSAAPEIVRAVATPAAAAQPPARPGGARVPERSRRRAARTGNAWLARVAWTVDRTGRVGLVGLALLAAAGLFLLSTHRQVVAEVETLRAELASARELARTAAGRPLAAPATGRALPARAEVPAILRQLFAEARRAQLAIDTGKYEVKATAGNGVVRYLVTFPVTGPYPQVRAFIDAALASMPGVALSDLALERKSIGDGNVEARLRVTVYTAAAGAAALAGAGPGTDAPGREGSPRAAEAHPAADRVVLPTYASALFAQHTWAVLRPVKVPPPPPPALPPPPPPPPEPTAPPFPFTFVGSFAPEGDRPVFFLARGDRVVDARVGDRLDGVYQLESAAGGQLVFVYLPLNIRQNLAAGVSK